MTDQHVGYLDAISEPDDMPTISARHGRPRKSVPRRPDRKRKVLLSGRSDAIEKA